MSMLFLALADVSVRAPVEDVLRCTDATPSGYGACETECPAQAFDAAAGLSDPTMCIECMRCVYICPDQVLKIDERMKGVYQRFLENWHLTQDMMEAKKSKIITEAWQAAF